MTPPPPTPPAPREPLADTVDHLVQTFKALSDSTRLRLVGLLAEREHSGQELAATLRLAPATVSHHLKVLRTAGLVTETRQTPYVYFALDLAALQRTLQSVSRKDRIQAFAADTALPSDKRRVLNAFFDGPRLKSIPAQLSKKEIVLEELLRRLPRQAEFPEKELNRWLQSIHEDHCTLRREFIMGHYMERSGGVYRLTEKGRGFAKERRSAD